MTDEKDPAPPKDLSRESAQWWRSVVESYELQPHHVHLVTMAARCLDRAASARKALLKGGMTHRDGHGVLRPAPEITIEKNSMITFARLLRELRLDDVEEDEPRVPRNTLNWKRRNEGWLKGGNDDETPTPPLAPRSRAQ